MLKRIFKPVKSGRATFLVTFFSLLSYIIGLFRDRIIATTFGTTSLTDAYNSSFIIPDIIFNFIIAGALSAAFLPVFSEYLEKDHKEALKIGNTMLTATTLVISICAIIISIFIPEIVTQLFTRTTPEMQQNIIGMTRIMLISAIIFGISNTLGSILMSYKHFLSYSLSPIFYNAGIIFGIIFLEREYGIYSAAYGVLIGAILHCGIRIIDILKTKYRYSFLLDLKNQAFRKIIKLMIPRSLSLLAWQLNLLIFAIVGTKMLSGGWSAFSYARNIQSFAVSLFGIAISTAIFPYLASSINKNDQQSYTEQIEKTVRNILFLTIPSMIGILLLSKEIIDLILGGGNFQSSSINITALILFFFAFSIPLESLSHIFARAFYAIQDTTTAMFINVSGMILTALLTIFIAPKYGIHWFSISFTLGFLLFNILAITLLKKHLKNFNFKNLFTSLAKIVISSAVMIAAIEISRPLQGVLNTKIATVALIVIGGLSYIGTAYVLKSPELSSLKYLRKNLTKQ